jgi:hypothetical protein
MMKLNEELERKLNSELHKSAFLRSQATDVIDDINALLSGYRDIKAQSLNDNTISYRDDILNLLGVHDMKEDEKQPETVDTKLDEINNNIVEIALDYFSRGKSSTATITPVASTDVFVQQSEVLEKLRLYKELIEMETTETSITQTQGVTGYLAKMIGLSKESGGK